MYYETPFFFGIFPFLFFLLILFLIYKLITLWLGDNKSKHHSHYKEYKTSAEDLLREMFVRGEIDEKDFHYKLSVLRRADEVENRR